MDWDARIIVLQRNLTKDTEVVRIQSIISNQNTPSATIYPFHTVIPGANILKLISNNSEIIESITNESQVHLTRVVARFATTCINNRKKFVDSLAST